MWLDAVNEPHPDGVLFIQPEHGGKVVLDEEGDINGVPGLVAEVAASGARDAPAPRVPGVNQKFSRAEPGGRLGMSGMKS